MKRLLVLSLIIACNTTCTQDELNQRSLDTLLIDSEYLVISKSRIENKDPKLLVAFDKLMQEAEQAMKEGPYTVTHKEKLPPSGDKHDYASYSRYWWPDPQKADGLPYIRRDGETNPASQSLKESDRQRIGSLGDNTETLGLAYYFTGDEKYAIKAAELLRIWFLDEATKMNPNVNHAQCRPGHNTGTKSGILDGRLMTKALEGSLLITPSSALSEEDKQGLKSWAAEYFEWLTTDEMALDESKSKNNHGSYYDAQALYFALYCNNLTAAKELAHNFTEKRLNTQIRADGSMPEEMARTRPLFYSIYNLHAMCLVAHLSKKVGVDIWQAENENAPLKTALNFLAPYADQNAQWPEPTLKEMDRMDLYPILLLADKEFSNENFLELTENLPEERRQIHRANLANPLMR